MIAFLLGPAIGLGYWPNGTSSQCHETGRGGNAAGHAWSWFQCPNADKAVSTGIHCDIKAYWDLTERLSLDCPECGQVQQWSVSDA